MRILSGKGVWAWTEDEVPRAIEMAQAIGARMVLFKTGQEGHYFGEASRRVVRRIVGAGLAPLAWPVITCHDPDAEAEVAIQTILDGYAGLVFDIESPAAGRHAGARRLGQLMIETELPPEVMFFTSLPNISANQDIPYNEMAQFCRGGFMPQAYATFKWDAAFTLDVATLREARLWMAQLKTDLPVYPVLGLYKDEHGRQPLSVDESRIWLERLARHRPHFFSVYRAGVVPEAIWPLLAAVPITPRDQPPPQPPVEGQYVTVQRGDTMIKLCADYRCSMAQFWDWNGHLWDAAGKLREPRTLEHGWLVRVR